LTGDDDFDDIFHEIDKRMYDKLRKLNRKTTLTTFSSDSSKVEITASCPTWPQIGRGLARAPSLPPPFYGMCNIPNWNYYLLPHGASLILRRNYYSLTYTFD